MNLRKQKAIGMMNFYSKKNDGNLNEFVYGDENSEVEIKVK